MQAVIFIWAKLGAVAWKHGPKFPKGCHDDLEVTGSVPCG